MKGQKQQHINCNASAHLRGLGSLPVKGLQQVAGGQPRSQSHGKPTCRHMCMLIALAPHMATLLMYIPAEAEAIQCRKRSKPVHTGLLQHSASRLSQTQQHWAEPNTARQSA